MSDNGVEVKELFPEIKEDEAIGGSAFIAWLSAAGETIPAWWSQDRDIELRKFWKQSDHLSGTVNTLREMMIAIPFTVQARDKTIKSHVRQAIEFERTLKTRTESRGNFVAQGWHNGYGPFIEDYHTQDNGAFMAIEGPGDGPLEGMPTKLIHLDSHRCWRTQIPEWPVVYTDFDGKQYRLHKSRVINITSQSSSIVDMFGVGFCAVSRAINVSQNLIDIGRYKQEKLGSRPKRGILVGEGVNERSGKMITNTLSLADEAMDNLGLTRFAQLPFIGLPVGGSLSLLDLNSIPDGFDELTSTQLGVAVLALAFGVDMRQLAFALGVAGQTKADAEVQHLKMRGKGPGAIIKQMKQQLESKFLPPYLEWIPDFQDDEQDLLNAEIRKVRSERREKDLTQAVTSIRIEREQMVENGELSEAQFIQLELEDGRLPDGHDVLTLFQSPDPVIQDMLSIGLDAAPEEVEERIQVINSSLFSSVASVKNKAMMVLAALEKLKEQGKEPESEVSPQKPLRLSGTGVEALRSILANVRNGETSEENAVDIIIASGIPAETARRMVANAARGESTQEILEEAEVKSKLDAITFANYRPSEFEDKLCSNCSFNKDGFCDRFDFTFDKGFVCDEWREIGNAELLSEPMMELTNE